MRHRIGGIGTSFITGLGNPAKCLLGNTGKKTKPIIKMFDDSLKVFFGGWGFDYDISSKAITFGQEPAYQYENLKIISINRIKKNSWIRTGHAFGGYGSGIRSRVKYYKEYKRKSVFVDFVNKWHSVIFSKRGK